MTKNTLYFQPQEYLGVLNHLRERISNGEKLVFYDSTAIGDKHTHCSWGLCSVNTESWPPGLVDRTIYGKAYTKYRDDHQHCPLSTKKVTDRDSWGCFYNCRVFNGEIREADREKVLEMYGDRIRDYVAFITGDLKEEPVIEDNSVEPIATESNVVNRYAAVVFFVGFMIFVLALVAVLS